jgi:NAD(P)H-dependent flavin oxidoreductase YrpB (nitropropane dioxygenase family)
VAGLPLGAQGLLLGTRFLATAESPLHPKFKQAVVDSDGHDTQLSEIPNIAAGPVWPGAMTRSRRNRSNVGQGVNGQFGKRELKPSQIYEQTERQAMSMKCIYQWDKMPDSFMTSGGGDRYANCKGG